VVWRFTGARTLSETAERRAHKAVAVTFFLLAPSITVDAVRSLAAGEHPQTTWLGIGLAVASLVVMPLLGAAKKRTGRRLRSAATSGEGSQNILCAYLAAAVLAGLLANTWLGWWWLDLGVGLLIAALAVRKAPKPGAATTAATDRPVVPGQASAPGSAQIRPERGYRRVRPGPDGAARGLRCRAAERAMTGAAARAGRTQ